MTAFVTQVSEQGAVRFAERGAALLPRCVVRFLDIERDDAIDVGRDDRLAPRRRLKQIEGEAVDGVLGLRLHRQPQPEQRGDELAFGLLDLQPAHLVLRLR